MIRRDGRIFVAGHRGLVGSAVVRRLSGEGFTNIVTRARDELDLRDTGAVDHFFASAPIDYVVLAAARVGGILANDRYPVEFLQDNLRIQLAVMEAAQRHGVEKLAFLGSSCIYPKYADQPMREEALLTGPLEETNRAYAIAKIAGIEMVRSYRKQHGVNWISLMPTNLYGPGDNFDPESSHVLPALIRKFHRAKLEGRTQIVLWGSGSPLREFLHVDDLADAILFLLDHYDEPEIINVGTGQEISIRGLADLIADVVGWEGEIVLDSSKPDGTPRKLMDSSRLEALGWTPSIALRDGIQQTWDWFVRREA